MKCPHCGTWSEVTETRAHADHVVRRSRKCANGHKFDTYEVTGGAYSHARAALERRQGAPGRRIALLARNRQIKAMFTAGHDAHAVAAKYALSLTAVRKIRRTPL